MSGWKVPHHFKVVIGGNRYIDCTTIIEYKGKSLFELRRSDSDGFLGINFDLYAHYGSKLATIRNGQFVGDKPPGYRIETSYDHFELIETETARRVCDIRLRSKASEDAELDVSAEMFMPDGKLLIFNRDRTNIETKWNTGMTFSGGSAIKIV